MNKRFDVVEDYLDSFKNIDVDEKYAKILSGSLLQIGEEIKPPPPVIQIDNFDSVPVTICSEGNISVVKGKAKSRKSFATTMITASCLMVGHRLGYRLLSPQKKKVIYIDTEQSKFYVQNVLERIRKIVGNDQVVRDNLQVFCLRPYPPKERLAIVDYIFRTVDNPGFAVIDGVRDLITDINSADDSTMLASKLLEWSDNTNCHIMTVLHENPSDGKLRGHIGTELMNKAETVLQITQMPEDKRISKISADLIRGHLDFVPIYYTVENSIPVVTKYTGDLSFLD